MPGGSEVNVDSPLTPPDATPTPRKPGIRLADTTPKLTSKQGLNKQRNANKPKPKPKRTPGIDDLPREPRPKMTQAERLAALSTPKIRDARITPGCHKYKPPVRGLAYRGSVEGTTYKHRTICPGESNPRHPRLQYPETALCALLATSSDARLLISIYRRRCEAGREIDRRQSSDGEEQVIGA